MSAADFFGLSLRQPIRTLRRWWLRRRIEAVGRELDLIRCERANGFAVERHLQGRQAVMQSDLRNI